MGHQNVATLLSFKSKLCGCNSYCVEAICNSLCEFVLKEQHVRFVSVSFSFFFSREHQSITFLSSAIPKFDIFFILIYYLFIPVLFSLQVTKEYVENQKPCSLFCSLCSLFFFFYLKELAKRQQTRSLNSCYCTHITIVFTILHHSQYWSIPKTKVCEEN